MRILWIVNSVLNDLSLYLYKRESNGVWMDALLADFKEKQEHELIVATVTKTKKTIRYVKDGIVYYALPNSYPIFYNENKKSNVGAWKKLIEDERPDLIQVWGTEFTHGLCALRVAGDIPSVVYMQGYLGSIARYYQAGIAYKDLKRSVTFRDLVKRDSILAQQKKYSRSAKKEAEILKLSGRIISENEWCNENVRSIVPTIRTYECPLSINKVFSQFQWNTENIERHSIMCTASGYTVKGLHMVLRAVALLKKQYPDVKAYVPGEVVVASKTLQGRLRRNGYGKYIEKLIKTLKIEENVVWLGRLSQKELAVQYARSHVFVMSSSIENHSSSLKEAMMVGVPCISSAVGGIPEYVKHGENGLLYRFEEYEMMAAYVGKIFESDGLAKRFSEAARKDMSALHEGDGLYHKITKIYREIKNEGK